MSDPRTRKGLTLLAGVLAAIAVWLPGHSRAQIQIQLEQVPQAQQLQPAAIGIGSGDILSGTVTVATDADADVLISRAAKYLRNQRNREALMLFQHVVDNYPDAMTPADNGVYVPARRTIERLLASFHGTDMAEVLELYRVSADASLQAIVGDDPLTCRDPGDLREGIRRYFLSSYGDEAVFALALLRLDAGRPGESVQLLARLEEHPDPSIDRRRLLAARAVAAARAGQRRAATEALAALQERVGRPEHPLLVRARAEIEALGRRDPAQTADAWTMEFGSARRNRVMPPLKHLPAAGGAALWAMTWHRDFPIKSPSGNWGGQATRNWTTSSRSHLVSRWRDRRWLPAGQLAFADNRVYYKTHSALKCVDARTGREVWTAGYSRLQHNSSNRNYYGHHNNQPSAEYPQSPEEVLLFGDRIAKQVAVIGPNVYHVEHHDMSVFPHSTSRTKGPWGNMLTAVDVRTGKARWRIGRQALGGENARALAQDASQVRFLGTPVPVNDRIAVCAQVADELRLVMLDPKSGKVVRSVFLCTSPFRLAMIPEWAPATIAVADDRLYILPGRGIIFAADFEGQLLWARPYKRSDNSDSRHLSQYNVYFERALGITGWDSNFLLPAGDRLVAAPFDAQKLFILERSSGSLVGAKPRSMPGGRALVGLHGDQVIAVTQNSIDAVALESGRTAWQARVRATGKPAMTKDAIYVPADDKIVRLDVVADGRRVATPNVVRPNDDPVGNLYSDGERLLAVGLNHVYALADATALKARLDQQIADGPDAEAYLQRARLHEQLNQPRKALADLRRVMETTQDKSLLAEARLGLVDRLLTQAEADMDAADAGELLAEARQIAGDDPEPASRVTLALARHATIHGRPVEAAEAYLGLIDTQRKVDAERRLLVERSDDDGWRKLAATLAAEQGLNRLLQQHRSQTLDYLEPIAEDYMARARAFGEPGSSGSARRIDVLRHVALHYPGTPASLEAIGQLGQFEPSVGLDPVEPLLVRLSQSPDPNTAAAATASLARLYDQLDWAVEARRHRTAVIERFPELAVMLYHGPSVAGRFAPWPLTVAVAAPRAEVADAADARVRPVRRMPEPPWKQSAHLKGTHYLLDTGRAGPGGSPFFDRYTLVMRQGQHIACYEAGRFDAIKWRIPIHRETAQRVSYSHQGTFFNGVFSDRVLVVRDANRWRTYSLTSGKVLPFEVADNQSSQQAYYRTVNLQQQRGVAEFAVGGGIVARHEADEHLNETIIAANARTAQTLWRRQVEGHAIMGLAAGGGAILALLDNGQQLMSFDRNTGEKLGQVKLSYAYRPVWHEDYVLFYDHNSGGQVVCYRLPTLEVAWRQPCNGNQNFGLLDDQTAFAIDRKQRLLIFDLHSGKARATPISSKVIGGRINDGNVGLSDDGLLYCLGYDNNRNNRFLSIINVATGKRVHKIDLGRQYYHPPSMAELAQSGGLIPWPTRQKKNNRLHMEFYDPHTGKKTDHTLPKNITKNLSYIYIAPQLRGDKLVISSNQGMYVIGHDAEAAAELRARQIDLPIQYKVEPGDSLAALAKRYYGHAKHWKRIHEANKDKLDDPNLLPAGLELTIPKLDGQGEGEGDDEQAAASDEQASDQPVADQAANARGLKVRMRVVGPAVPADQVQRVIERRIELEPQNAEDQ